jgi:membrane-bound serine protease (ClpP class)
MPNLFWPIVLLLAGLALIFLEAFIPSAGVIGTLSVTSVIAAVTMAFMKGGSEVGLTFVAVASVAMPLVLMLALRWLPYTPMGQRLLLRIPKSHEVLPDSPELEHLRSLVGRVAVAESAMLPSGIIRIGKETIDAVSDGNPIERGQQVQICEVKGNRVLVTRYEPPDAPQDGNSSHPLDRPIDEIVRDPFREEQA